MPTSITLSDDTFAQLQALAKPFVDTPESVISDLARAELQRRAHPNGQSSYSPESPKARELNPDAPVSLTHTRLLAARVDERELYRPKWNGILDHLHLMARERLGSFEEVRKVSTANLRAGRFEESGFRYLPEVDFSIQGVDSNLAWSHSLGLARALGVSLELILEWRQKEGAAYPGERATLGWRPTR